MILIKRINIQLSVSFLLFIRFSMNICETFVSWWRWWDSNPWPPACRAGALPAELHPQIILGILLFLHLNLHGVKISLFDSSKNFIRLRISLLTQSKISLQALACLVGPSGLEPPTSCLSGTRSNLLSYEPLWLVSDLSHLVVEMMGFGRDANYASWSPSVANVHRKFALYLLCSNPFRLWNS